MKRKPVLDDCTNVEGNHVGTLNLCRPSGITRIGDQSVPPFPENGDVPSPFSQNGLGQIFGAFQEFSGLRPVVAVQSHSLIATQTGFSDERHGP